ncbi:hypothetical protein TraAM80_08571, partial [Trypanosoma rangeli]
QATVPVGGGATHAVTTAAGERAATGRGRTEQPPRHPTPRPTCPEHPPPPNHAIVDSPPRTSAVQPQTQGGHCDSSAASRRFICASQLGTCEAVRWSR